MEKREEKKIRLVHMITSLERGGAQTVLYELLEGLDKTRFEQVVIYFIPGVYVQKIEALGIKTYHVRGFLCAYDPLFFVRLIRLIKVMQQDKTIDCLHTVLWSANFIGRIFASYYHLVHIESLHNMIELNGFLRRLLDRCTARKHGTLIAVSQSIVQSFEKKAPWFVRAKEQSDRCNAHGDRVRNAIRVIKNGISVGATTVTTGQENVKVTRADLGLTDTHIIIGSVGRFESVKNYRLLLTAFALLYDIYPKARLLLIGNGSLEHFLRLRAFHLGIDDRVIFVVNKDAQDYYQLFDCFVQCSLSEGMSMALLEAMAHGIAPVVTCLDKRHDVVIHEQTGLLVHSYQAQALADALEKLLQSRALRRQLGQAAQESMRTSFRIDTMVREYSQIVEQEVKLTYAEKSLS